MRWLFYEDFRSGHAARLLTAAAALLAVLSGPAGCSKREEPPPPVAPRDLPSDVHVEAGAAMPALPPVRPMLQPPELPPDIPGIPGQGDVAGIPVRGAPGPPDAGAALVPEAGAGVGAPLGVNGLALPGPLGDRERALEWQREEIAASDRDRDGALSEEEYLQRYIERHKRRFELLDYDRDGKLSAEEMADMMDPQKMMERAQQPIIPPAGVPRSQ